MNDISVLVFGYLPDSVVDSVLDFEDLETSTSFSSTICVASRDTTVHPTDSRVSAFRRIEAGFPSFGIVTVSVFGFFAMVLLYRLDYGVIKSG